MKDDAELQMDDADDSTTYSPKRRRIGSGNSKSLRILLGVILVLIFAGGILISEYGSFLRLEVWKIMGYRKTVSWNYR